MSDDTAPERASERDRIYGTGFSRGQAYAEGECIPTHSARREVIAELHARDMALRAAFADACRKADAVFDDAGTMVIQVRITRAFFDELLSPSANGH